MPSFVVETYVPGGDPERFAVDVDGIRAAADAGLAGGQVRHVRSYLVQADEMGFHIVEASSADDVARITDLASVEVERIVRAVELEPPEADRAPELK